jgi:hypothetical protein
MFVDANLGFVIVDRLRSSPARRLRARALRLQRDEVDSSFELYELGLEPVR